MRNIHLCLDLTSFQLRLSLVYDTKTNFVLRHFMNPAMKTYHPSSLVFIDITHQVNAHGLDFPTTFHQFACITCIYIYKIFK